VGSPDSYQVGNKSKKKIRALMFNTNNVQGSIQFSVTTKATARTGSRENTSRKHFESANDFPNFGDQSLKSLEQRK
jgi:hypothetical protein